jgi:hypothetical protein
VSIGMSDETKYILLHVVGIAIILGLAEGARSVWSWGIDRVQFCTDIELSRGRREAHCFVKKTRCETEQAMGAGTPCAVRLRM